MGKQKPELKILQGDEEVSVWQLSHQEARTLLEDLTRAVKIRLPFVQQALFTTINKKGADPKDYYI